MKRVPRFGTGLVAAVLALGSLTVAASPPPAGAALPGAGPGGPILVVTNAANPFSSYLSEILLGEGLNEFDAVDLAGMTPSELAAHTTVVLGATALSPTQAADLTTWVNAGGNLIAMRPDTDLASLLGITPVGAALNDASLQVVTNSGPGVGI